MRTSAAFRKPESIDPVLDDRFRSGLPPVRRLSGIPSAQPGYFTFCGSVCFGRLVGFEPAAFADGRLPEVVTSARWTGSELEIPFDLAEVRDALRLESYRQSIPAAERITGGAGVRRAYYTLRQFMPVAIRRHLQKMRLTGWERIPFPAWPVDVSADRVLENSLRLMIERQGLSRVPFIWFWPDGASACAMMTHDVEGVAGHDFCATLMDIDDSFGISASFQVVPDGPAAATSAEIAEIRRRGFEVNVHDLNHDGSLFKDHETFPEKARAINQYARALGCRGFRAGAMYREQAWMAALDFDYDMSVPNAAHLEPQRGGCCTVFPYFLGQVLELPLTTTQDYSLFHILGEYSIRLWKEQIDVIAANHGLISFITHPDYLIEKRARRVYADLLAHLTSVRQSRNIWVARPGEINEWWRQRASLDLVRNGSQWQVIGAGRERARIAFASVRDGRLVYELA